MHRFADERDAQGRPVRKADYFHGSQRLEVIWTIIPAAILVFIALYQMGTWAEIKFRSSAPKVRPLAEITGRQFQWVMRYPGPDGLLNTRDDLVVVNDLHFVKNKHGADLPEIVRRAPFLLPAAAPDQAGRRPGPDDPGLVRRRQGRRIRAGLCRAVRLGPLQDARPGHGPRDGRRVPEVDRRAVWPSRTGASSRWLPVPRGGDLDECRAFYQRAVRRRPEGFPRQGRRPCAGPRSWPRPWGRSRPYPSGAPVLPDQVRLLDGPQGHRHPVPVLRADLLRPRRPAGHGGPLAARLAMEADADPGPPALVRPVARLPDAAGMPTTSCSPCTRRS